MYIKAMDSGLRDLLQSVNYSDSNSEGFTHVSIYGPHARWTIKNASRNDFWLGYCKLVYDNITLNKEPLANYCLAERAQESAPVICKINLKYQIDKDDDGKWEPYDDDFLHWLCHAYQTVIREFFKVDNDDDVQNLAVVMESSEHYVEVDKETNTHYMKMEIRIQFSYARVDCGLQGRLIRPRVIQFLRNNNVMAKMQRQPIGDWEEIISKNMINEPILMYGSAETPNFPKLTVTHMWPFISRECLDTGEPVLDIDAKDVFNISYHAHAQQKSIDEKVFSSIEDINFLLPFFMSMNYYAAELVLRSQVKDDGRFISQTRDINASRSTKAFGSNNNFNNDETDIDLADKFISMFSYKRFTNETNWLDIGKALYNADDGGDNGLFSWIRNSQKVLDNNQLDFPYMKSDGDLKQTCSNLYHTFANNPVTIKTLAWYAKEDNPNSYAVWHSEWCKPAMEQALSCLHTDVAMCLYRVYWLEYVYCPVGKGKWFKFKGHRWYEMNQSIDLKKMISSGFLKKFEFLRVNVSREIHESNDEATKSQNEILLKKITNLIGKLKTVAFKSSIMTEVSEQFSNDKFISLLDTNSELTGVMNGVIELRENQAIFRAGKPEDNISMCTNNPFHENFTWNHPLVIECMKWIGQVFIEKELKHHFLKFASSCLKGKNSDKIFPIWTGDGDNSKSMIVKLFESTLNVYCIKFPVALLSEKSMNSSGPSPQLARAKSTRVAFLDEPEDDIPMQKGTIKRYTGGDSFFARQLQENGGDIQASFKMILMCNKVPIIPNADKAIKNRARIFPFMSTWVDDPPTTESEQYEKRKFKKNPAFERRIPQLAPAFLWIMVQYYPYYYSEGLIDPQIVRDHTESYWRDNDVYAQFAADNIQEVFDANGNRDSSARITLSEIYAEFKMWYRDTFPGQKVLERTVVRTELTSRWGRMHGNAWHGIRLVSNESKDMTAALGGKPKIYAEPVKLNIQKENPKETKGTINI